MQLLITIKATPLDKGDTVEGLWAAMAAEIEKDPKHRLTLETHSYIADVTSVSVVEGSATDLIARAGAIVERHELLAQCVRNHQGNAGSEAARFQRDLDHIERVYAQRLGG